MGIKENIKRIREIYDLTQQELADIAGVTNKAVSAWESGLSEPRMGAIERIANRFGITKSHCYIRLLNRSPQQLHEPADM